MSRCVSVCLRVSVCRCVCVSRYVYVGICVILIPSFHGSIYSLEILEETNINLSRGPVSYYIHEDLPIFKSIASWKNRLNPFATGQI